LLSITVLGVVAIAACRVLRVVWLRTAQMPGEYQPASRAAKRRSPGVKMAINAKEMWSAQSLSRFAELTRPRAVQRLGLASAVLGLAIVACNPEKTTAPAVEPRFALPTDTLANCVGGAYQLGLIASTDLAGGIYVDPQGGTHPGGLYDTGLNTRPPEIDAVMPIVTRVNNVIGVATLGGSTIRKIGDSLLAAMKRDPLKNGYVKVANGGIGGRRMDHWADPNSTAWPAFATVLSKAGIQPTQLRVVLVMDIQAVGVGTFEGEVAQNAAWMDSTVSNIRAKYPSVQIVYLTSHHYLGYSSAALEITEPLGYWNAWSVQRVVRRRAGTANPWTVVGPYIWSNGLGPDHIEGGFPGRLDGMEYACSDFQPDGGSAGVHMIAGGALKATSDFMAFLHNDASTIWYR
jgi:hypothetical protein